MQRDPSQMSYPTIIEEISSLKEGIRRDSRRVYELARVLQERVRRQGADEYTSRYMHFTNAYVRFAMGVDQSLQRTTTFDKIVRSIQKDKDGVAEKAQKKADLDKRMAKKSVGPEGLDELVSLFGQEMINASAP